MGRRDSNDFSKVPTFEIRSNADLRKEWRQGAGDRRYAKFREAHRFQDISIDTRSMPAFLAGYVLTALVALFLAFDTVIKVLRLAPAVQGTTDLGYSADTVLWIGMIELVCVGLYLLPRTSVLGGLLLTGYLGGAIATHVRARSPLLSHTLFPIYVALLIWGGLYLRETRLRALIPFRRQNG